jgi:hypothetical protein
MNRATRPGRKLRALAVAGAVGVNLLFIAMLALPPRPPEHVSPQRVVIVAVPARPPAPEVTERPRAAPKGPRVERPTSTRPSITPAPAVAQVPMPPAAPTAEAPAPPASAPLRLDDATLRRATAGARRGSTGEMAHATGAPIDDTKSAAEQLTEGVERSRRADCRSAHAGKGLFAPLFLLRDGITDTGCKW